MAESKRSWSEPAFELPFGPGGRMLSVAGTKGKQHEQAGLNNRHRNKDGEISGKRKVYGQSFAAGYPETDKPSEVLQKLNETSLSQLRRDHETGQLDRKIVNASK